MARSARPCAEQPGRAVVLACGNTLRGDDGVGWRIGRALKQEPPRIGVTVILTQQLLPEHAEAISVAETVVIVDCSALTAPGTVSIIAIQPAKSLPRILSHHLDPASLLRLVLDLYGHTPAQAVVITVGGESFQLTEELSKRVEAAIPQTLKAVRCVLLSSL